MRALTWQFQLDVRVATVPDPKIINPRDIIIKVTATAICGSDVHISDSFIPWMLPVDIICHEFMGEVVESGKHGSAELTVGDRVVIVFNIACGNCPAP